MEDVIRDIGDGIQSQEIIEKVLSLPREQQERLMEQIGRLKSEKAARFLTLFYPHATDKKLQKLIKKEFFRLKTQGVPVDEPRAAGESVLKKTEITVEARALLSNFDTEQARAVVTAVELKKNNFLFSHAIIHFSKGLMELRSFPAGRTELEQLVNESVQNTQRPMVLLPISAPYAGYVIEEASAISGKDPEEARSLSRLLSSAKGNVRRPSDIYLLEVDQYVRPASVETVLGSEVFSPFLLQWQGMEEDRKKMNEAVNPAIVLPPYVIQERREGFLRDLVSSERLGSQLSPFKRMLEDFAYLFYSLKEFSHYGGLVGLLKDPEGTKRALRYFAQIALEEQEKKSQQSSVLVDPYSLKKR